MRTNKSWGNDEGILPLIAALGIGAIATIFGIKFLFPDMGETIKTLTIASLLFVFGVVCLWGKFVVLTKPVALVLGLACVFGSIGYVWWVM